MENYQSENDLELSCDFAQLVGDCPAIDFHRILLAVTWTIVANAGIFSLLYKRSKLTYYVHSTLMWIVTILTFGGTFTLIGEAGIRLETEDGARRFTHNLLGLLLLVIVGALSLLGYTTHYLQETQSVRPKIVVTLRKVHVVLGYIVMILAKIIVQIGWWSDKVLFYISLGLEIIILIIWIWRYCCPSLLEHKKDETSLLLSKKSIDHENSGVKQIQSIKSLNLFPNEYVVFKDYVYEISPVINQHPGGAEIIRLCLGREIDRFMYGVETIETSPYSFRFSHSTKSAEMLGEPLAKFKRSQMYEGLKAQNFCQVQKVVQLPQSQVFIIWLSSQQKEFEYRGFHHIENLGQYFAVTLNNKVTRLYTSVNFLVDSQEGKLNQEQSSQDGLMRSDGPQDMKSGMINSGIPLLIKKYDTGKFSSQICANFEGEVLISSNLGDGLALHEKNPGNILIVAGGTGIYPFLDLIDVLTKRTVMKSNPELQRKLVRRNPGLEDTRFNNFSFHFLVSLRDYHDLPQSMIRSMKHLTEKQLSQCSITLKLPNRQHQQFLEKVPAMRLTTENFQAQLRRDRKQYSHMYVCGAPMLVDEMVSFWMNEKDIQRQNITII